MTSLPDNTAPIDARMGAPIWRRLAAGIYDLLPVLALWFLGGAIAQWVTAGNLDTHRIDHKILLQALLLIPTAAYFLLSWLRGGQTLGMRAWGLRLVSTDQRRLDLARALRRFVVAIVSLLAAGLGFVWMLIDPQRRSWHDLVARTNVIRDRQP